MTIEFDGRIHAMSVGATDLDVSLQIRVEGIRCLKDIFINATHAETAHYKVGMPIKIQIRPSSSEQRISEQPTKEGK